MSMKTILIIIIILILTGFVADASNFKYYSGGNNYSTSLAGDGVINPSLTFNVTGGYIVPDHPENLYQVYNQTIVFNTQAWESPGGGSISTMYDSNPVILNGSSYVFKTWYQAGSSPQCMGYAESTNGYNWTKYASNPVISGYMAGKVVKENGVYYMFVENPVAPTWVQKYFSTDGVTWTFAGQIITAPGGWATYFLHQDVWKDSDNHWKMLVSGANASSWSVGLYESTSVNGTWTASAFNPVIQKTITGNGSGLVYLPSGTYKDNNGYTWTWISAANNFTAAASYTDTMRFRTTNPNNLTSWSANPISYLNLGLSRYMGYPGDWQGRSPQDYVRYNNMTYEFYTYNTAGHPGYNGLLITPLRIDHIVATDEMYPNLTYQQL
jgi:hypothetical protein